MNQMQESQSRSGHGSWAKKLELEHEFLNQIRLKQSNQRRQLRLKQQELLLIRSQWKSSRSLGRQVGPLFLFL